jgi:hypothetical protein
MKFVELTYKSSSKIKAGGLVLAALIFCTGRAVAQTYSVLHNFGSNAHNSQGATVPDGLNPEAGVVFDSAGNMYGTTFSEGDDLNGGVVWEITKSGSYIVLHQFGASMVADSEGVMVLDGLGPAATPVFDGSGNLFGVTNAGGAYQTAFHTGGIIWEITAGGVYKDLHDFGGKILNTNGKMGPDGESPSGLAFDSSWNLYGTAALGGPNLNNSRYGGGLVWERTESGVYKDLHDFGGTITYSNGKKGLDGYYSQSGVAINGSGDLYGTAAEGGANKKVYPVEGDGIVWEITSGGTYKDIHDFGGVVNKQSGGTAADGAAPSAGVNLEYGYVFGTTYAGGAGSNGNLWVITSGGDYADLHDFGFTVHDSNGAVVSDGVNPVCAVTFDVHGNMYGTAQAGGAKSGGIVWEFDQSYNYTDVRNFDASVGSVDGWEPYAAVTFDNAGDMFGTTYYGGQSALAGTVWKISAAPPALTSFTDSPTAVTGGASSIGTLTLDYPAPSGGATVTLVSNSSSVKVPSTVHFAAGIRTTTFTITTVPVAKQLTASIKATLGSTVKAAELTVKPAALDTLSFSPSTVVGRSTTVVTGELILTGDTVAGQPITISLKSSNGSAIKVPATIIVAGGSNFVKFAVQHSNVTFTQKVTVTATYGSESITGTITVEKV